MSGLHWLGLVCVQTNCLWPRVQPQVLWEFYNFLVGQGPETEPGHQEQRGGICDDNFVPSEIILAILLKQSVGWKININMWNIGKCLFVLNRGNYSWFAPILLLVYLIVAMRLQSSDITLSFEANATHW